MKGVGVLRRSLILRTPTSFRSIIDAGCFQIIPYMLSGEPMKSKLLITITLSFALGIAWGILSNWLFPGDRAILWAGIAVLVVLGVLIIFRYLPTTSAQQKNIE
jgi:lipoprotein signal peptidase